jgi:predicted lipoprotein with Yx(FWY)xxD motif
MRRFLPLLLLVAVAVAATAAAAATKAKIGVHATSVGSALVDARGRTLYVYGLDKGTKSSCVGACATNWPAFVTSGKPAAAAGVAAAKIGTVKRADGKLQVTFAGHPLYFFGGDAKAGDAKGAAVAHWAALSATGAKLRAAAAGDSQNPPPTATTPDPGYGGGDGYGY